MGGSSTAAHLVVVNKRLQAGHPSAVLRVAVAAPSPTAWDVRRVVAWQPPQNEMEARQAVQNIGLDLALRHTFHAEDCVADQRQQVLVLLLRRCPHGRADENTALCHLG